MAKPKQIDKLEILNDDDRIFKSWGSVEVVDKEGQLIPINEFKKIMPTLMDRGGIITDRHSNRVVAKILNYVFKEKETDDGPKDALFIEGKVFKNYAIDDMIWEGIKKGIYKGLSFGGRNHQLDMKYDKSGPIEVLKQLEGFEFALVPGMGNQEATMEEVNYLAKCDKEEIQKPFAGFKDFDDCVKQNQDKDDPNAFCGFLQARVEDVEKQFTNDKDVEKELTKNDLSLSQESDTNEKYLKKSALDKSMEQKDVKKEDVIETPSTPEAPTNPMEEIKNMLAQILQAVQTPAAPVAPTTPAAPVAKEEDDEDKDKKEDVEKEEDVTLPKTPEEETGEGKPAEGAESDKVKFVEKKDLDVFKQEIVAEIKKGLFNKETSTPRPGVVGIKQTENKAPKNWQDVQKMVDKRI